MKCLHCGARMPDARRQPHCWTDACNRGYAEHMAVTQIREEGACHVWTGKLSSAKTPMICVKTGRNGTKDGVREEFRVLDVRYEMAGREKGAKRRYRNTCGTPRCVTVEHNEIVQRDPVEPEGLKGHLDPLPLQRRLDRCGKEIPAPIRKYMYESLQRGWVSVGKVDEICCDFLGCHPLELYGEEFFTA